MGAREGIGRGDGGGCKGRRSSTGIRYNLLCLQYI